MLCVEGADNHTNKEIQEEEASYDSKEYEKENPEETWVLTITGHHVYVSGSRASEHHL